MILEYQLQQHHTALKKKSVFATVGAAWNFNADVKPSLFNVGLLASPLHRG